MTNVKNMDIYEIKVLLAVHVGNEELVLKNAGGKKLADSNDYFVVTNDGCCHLFDANGIEKYISVITTLIEDIVSKDIKKIIIPDSVTNIEASTFYVCTSLTSVTISNSVTNIRDSTFWGCINLTSVVIPNSVTSIRDNAFSYCTNLTSVTIPNSVTSIGENAFLYCRSLTSVTIPDSVTNIGLGAFANCTSLSSITIPKNVASIGPYVFAGCSNLKPLIFKGKTLREVQSMKNYPFGIKDESFIICIDEMHAA